MISWVAADALGKIGPDAAPAIPDLVAVIKSERGKGKTSETGGEGPSTYSWLAGKALAEIGSASIHELVSLLEHEDRFVRMTAALALGTMGPQARTAVPALNQTLNDPDETVRRYSRVALNRIGCRPTAPQDSLAPPDAGDEAANKIQEIPIGVWTTLASYTGDPRTRPRGSVCVTFDDGYRWLVAETVVTRERRVEGDRKIEIVVTPTRRLEHVLGTKEVRITAPASGPP
jgi:hypothetical protein